MSFWGMPIDVFRAVNQMHGRGFGHQAMMDDDSKDFNNWQDELTKVS